MINLGLLSASRIATRAVIEPAAEVEGVTIAGVAARDLGRAQQMAKDCRAPHAWGSYRELIASPEIDAVYIATPASLHREWAIAAIEAGKHVLCEKPFAANAADAQLIADADRAAPGVVVMEAFHWRYHPYADQIRAVIDSGELGEVTRIDAHFDIADGLIGRDDIRWDLSIGGGALMDLGCYPIQWVRFAAGADPTVASASAECPVPGVDAQLQAELEWPSGVTGSIHTSMIAPPDSVSSESNALVVTGTKAAMTANNPLAPQNGASLTVVTNEGRTRTEAVPDSATYFHQLVAFRDAITDRTPFPTTSVDGVTNMAIIDECYRAAGLDPRPAA